MQNLLEKIHARMSLAVIFHREACQAFQFLALDGYAKEQEYRMHSELAEQTAAKRFIFEQYGIGMADAPPNYDLLEKPMFDGMEQGKVDTREAVKTAFNSWHRWEAQTLAERVGIAAQLQQAGDIVAFNFVAGLVDDVRMELAGLHNEHLRLMACDFDMPTILATQGDLRKKYKKKLRGIF